MAGTSQAMTTARMSHECKNLRSPPRKRGSRATDSESAALDSRFRGNERSVLHYCLLSLFAAATADTGTAANAGATTDTAARGRVPVSAALDFRAAAGTHI